jgi:hypothetical protein
MLPVDFPGTNMTIDKPPTMTDEEECLSIRAYGGVDNDGYAFILTAWQPSYEDIQAINRGEPIYLKQLVRQMPVTFMATLNEKGEVN